MKMMRESEETRSNPWEDRARKYQQMNEQSDKRHAYVDNRID